MTAGAGESAPPAAWRLQCVDLCVARGRRNVLADVNLTVAAGECTVIIGPNGSGKTTLLLALLGLLPPADGAVRLNGVDLARLTARQRGRFAAYVPQRVAQTPPFRVYDVVAGGRFPHVPELRGLGPADHAAIRQALERCGLTSLAERTFDTLSGGERQKTLLAAAMAQEPQLLALDEPNTGLDPAYQLELVRILRAWRSSGRGLVVVSHDLQLPAVLGGRVIALSAGRVGADGPAEDVLRADVLERLYGAPFATAGFVGGQVVLPDWWAERR